jgi:hypothetical protein
VATTNSAGTNVFNVGLTHELVVARSITRANDEIIDTVQGEALPLHEPSWLASQHWAVWLIVFVEPPTHLTGGDE